MSLKDEKRTIALYANDTYMFTGSARIISVDAVWEEVEKKWGEYIIILDKTIFYPQGGGQPADKGIIKFSCNEFDFIFTVGHVLLKPESGVILHFGKFIHSNSLNNALLSNDCMQSMIGREAELTIDGDLRILHARIHSAGHLLDFILQKNFPTFTIESSKSGFHFPSGPYLEYFAPESFDSSPNGINAFQSSISEGLKSLDSSGGLEIICRDLEIKEAEAILGANAISEKARQSPMIRMIQFGGEGNMGASFCGGTHVRHSSEIGSIVLRKVSAKAGIIRIAYNLSKMLTV